MSSGAVLATILLAVLTGCGRQPPEETVTIPPNAPRCVIGVLRDGALFDETVLRFAKSSGFQQCEVPHYSLYSGPGYPVVHYKNEQFAIWRWHYELGGIFHVAPHTTNYSRQDFDRLTNTLLSAVDQALPGIVQVNPTNLWKR